MIQDVIVVILIIGMFGYFSYQHRLKKKAAEANIKAAEEYLQKNLENPEVVQTDTGLQYKIIESSGSDSRPTSKDKVKVHYHGTLIDGTVFDSSVKRGQPISFGLNQVIAGWTEGLQLMAVGDKFQLFIPSKLGYGNRAAGKIPGGALLIFEVELLGINEQ